MALHKIIRIVAWLLGIAGIVTLALIISTGDEAIKAGEDGVVNPMTYVAYITAALVLAFTIVFVLKGIFSGDLKKTLLAIGSFIVIVAIAYGLSNGVETQMRDGEMLSASGSRWVGTGLHTFYILAILAIGAMVYSGVVKMTTRR
ncbi:hypothetical protein [Luteirhabdus pelagi]|uniref:hypothetical protein n=1 Tax=Luteirhabdus pelagi TaxID=2792783 RepID=UPI00193A1912|nr:hypothetical protein [Luteirhabdus pelagi]